MGTAQSVAALVTGILLAVLGGVGSVVVLVGALADVMAWTTAAWLLPLALVVGIGLFTYGLVGLLDEASGLLTGDGPGELISDLDAHTLRKLLD